MRTTGILALVSCSLVACATGILAPSGDDNQTDGGIVFKDSGSSSKDSGATSKDATTSQPDTGTPCAYTTCGSQCIDTTGDDLNCGSCGNACPSGASCTASVCVCSSGTLCSASCVDTTSDNSNCGSCGKTCTSSQTCISSKCTATSTAPPQGSCSHSLCTSGTYLDDGCDTTACTTLICDYYGDDFCCDTAWDSTCVSEVTSYCSPYSCP
jgi:hypothetical protein